MNKIMEIYARHFGIGDLDVAESPWLADWIKRHSNRLFYSHLQYRWFLLS